MPLSITTTDNITKMTRPFVCPDKLDLNVKLAGKAIIAIPLLSTECVERFCNRVLFGPAKRNYSVISLSYLNANRIRSECGWMYRDVYA